MKNSVKIISILSVVSLLVACGGDGGGVPAVAPSGILDGTVTDAVITNGTLRVFKFDDGKQGDLLAETVTDGNGDFEIANFTSQDRPVVIEVSGGRYTEEASGVSVNLLDGQVLRAYMFYEQGSAITLQVTPFTHMASCLADYKIRTGVNVNNAITGATSAFSGLAGVDILGTKPLDITNPNNANFEVTDSLRYGALLAAISSFTAEVSETNGVTPHRFNQNSSIYATQVLCQDIAADGVFNGLGYINNGNSVGQLSLGSVPLDVNTLRTKVAQHILSIISSERNQTSLNVDDFVLYANEIASSTDGVFGGVPATAVDQEGPTVTAVLAPDSFLKGIVNLNFIVTDPIGVKSVQFKVNDVVHSNGQSDNPVMSINSSNYTDGIIKITVVATDILNNVSNIDFNYVVDNTSPIIVLTSAKLVNNKAYSATGTYQEQGAFVTSIQVNGVDASINTDLQTWSADIALLSGENIVTLDITDAAANTNSTNVNVGVDLIFPQITPNSTLTTYTTFQGQLNLCTSGQITPNSSVNNPVCMSTDNVSLNGAALDGALQNNGYALLGFSPTDPQGAGVFTAQDQITVEYKYELNNVVVVDWTIAPKTTSLASRDLFYYFPMVTEYLGTNWYQSTTNDVHRVTFRVTDLAGNFKELAFDMQFDILVPEIAINTVIDETLFNASSFANRTAIDGAGINVTYSFDNTSNNLLLISLADNQLHSVKHTYETGIRENQAQLVSSKNWQFKFVNADNSVTDWLQPTNVYNGVGGAIPTTTNSYSGYQAFIQDTITAPASTVWVAKPIAEMCNFAPSVQNFYGTNVYSTFHKNVTIKTVRDLSTGFNYPVIDDAAAVTYHLYSGALSCVASLPSGSSASTTWRENTSYSYEYKLGFPRNNINAVITDYDFNTEELTVINSTLGQVILPVGGWFKVPPKTAIAIIKKVRMPVLNHFYDEELANLSALGYSLKKQDKTTVWNIDTDLTVTRVIDPGSIQDVNNVTPSISLAGLGIYKKTISR